MATLKVEVPENSQNILSTVTVKAPLEKVFEAYTNKDLFIRWFLTPGDNEIIGDTFNAVTGGSWQLGEKSSDGEVAEFCGSFHEVAKNERIIWTFEFLGLPERGHVSIEKQDFVAISENVTEIRALSTFFSREDRDGMIASGMEDGFRQSVEALGRLLENESN